MDPRQTFLKFVNATLDGDYTGASEASEDYNNWIRMHGYPDMYDGMYIIRLDLEQDRFGLAHSTLNPVEKWVAITEDVL